MLKSIRTAVAVAAVTLSLSGLATNALADDTQWQKTPPAPRAGEQSGSPTRTSASIRSASKARSPRRRRPSCTARTTPFARKERTMASTNGGHITKAEQKALNQQEKPGQQADRAK